MTESSKQLDILFVSEKPLWPMDQGFRIRGSHLSSALEAMGLKVGTACMGSDDTSEPPLAMKGRFIHWPDASAQDLLDFKQAWRGFAGPLRQKVASHQGVDLASFAGIRPLVQQYQPKIVVALGQHGPMLLRGIHDQPVQRIWYAADEPLRFQFSCMARESMIRWPERLRQMAVYGALELAFVRGLDGAIGVSPTDTKMLRRLAGAKQTVTIRNGVDLSYFHPSLRARPSDASLVFWGRLDFEPNIDAVKWFAREVWPALRKHKPDARWTIVGKYPHASLNKVAQLDGVTLLANVPDIRPHAHNATLTILPMRCGGGIKNKLLEGAAMSLPMVASPRAVQGLDMSQGHDRPVHLAATPGQWVQHILTLWSDQNAREALGRQARQWAIEHHSWATAARSFIDWAQLTLPQVIAPEWDPHTLDPHHPHNMEAA